MSKNPFAFHGPVTDPDVAYWRDVRAVDGIVNGLLLGNYYTLLGPRLSGTTSMTWDILRTACEREKRCRCLYIDLRVLDGALDDRSLFQGIAKIGQGLPPETALLWSDVTGCADFREALVATVRGKPARLIVALDHLDSESLPFELIKTLVRCTRVLYNQRLTGPEYNKISVLISGSQSPYALSTGPGSPFNIAEKYWLRDLTPQEVEQLIRMAQQLSGIFFNDAAIARIAAATEGDKYFVQRICHLCVQEAQDAGTQTVTEVAVSDIIERLASMDYREDRCFTPLVKSLKREPELVGILVDLLEGKEVIASECQADLNKMQLTGVLKFDEGKYRFRNEVYEHFLSHRKEMVKDGWKIHAQVRKLVGLHDVTLAIASTLDPETALKEAAWTVLRASEADTVAIYLFDRTMDRFCLEAIASREELHVADLVLRRDEIAREIVARPAHFIVEDQTSCGQCDLHRKSCSCIWLPLVVSNDALGIMVITFDGHHDFSDKYEIMAAESMASHLAIVATRTNLLRALKEDMATLTSLYRVSTKLRTSLNPEDVLKVITTSLQEMFNLATCTIGLLDESEERLDFVAHRGLSGPTTRFVRDLPQDLWRKVREEKQYIFLDDVAKHPELVRRLERQDLNSFAVFPLQGKEKFLGILTMSSTERFNLDVRLGLITALTDQAAVAIENAQLYQEARQARKALDDSLKILTHQLHAEPAFVTNTINTLLAGKLGYLDDKQRDRLEKARRRLDGHHRLIDNIDIYGRLKGGKIIPRRGTVQIAQMIRGVIDSHRSEAKRRGLKLTAKLRRLPAPAPTIEADVGMIEITLANLLDNAIKFTPQGGHIRVEAWADVESVHIVVDDTGAGIPVEERERVFDEYYQVESSPIRVEKGAGLGLYIAKKFVKMHKGRLDVVDKEGPGTRIKVILPR